MEKPPLLISKFDKNLISLLIRESFGAKFPDITQKKQIQYLFNYLQNLKAETVVCETSYTDKDYLADYQEYYVRCFHNYSNKCARLHFFSKPFNYSELISDVEKGEVDNYKESYLGFSVIKPLPVTFLGRTCLKHYDETDDATDDAKRKYISRPYKAHLLGIDLTVNSIAYQEQDKVVSACATTALWSLMHATIHLPISDIPSPSEITLNAISNYTSNINGFPNKGLSDSEVIKTLEFSKLKMHEFKVDSKDGITIPDLNTHIKNHVDSNIPIFAGVSVYRRCTKDKIYKFQGDHAISVLGYKESDGKLCTLYVHDDRVGPYARAIKKSSQVEIKEEDTKTTKFIDDYYSIKVKGDNATETEIFILKTLKTATYYKIRIPYNLILSACKDLQTFINDTLIKYVNSPSKLQFTIELLDSNKAKHKYLYEDNITNKSTLLIMNWPRYIWKCSFKIDDSQLFYLIYDTTDIPLGNGLIHFIEKNSKSTKIILDMLKTVYDSTPKESRDSSKIELSFFYSTLRKIFSEEDDSFEANLEKLFGPLNPPTNIKPEEIYEEDITKNFGVDEYILGTEGEPLSSFFNEKVSVAIWVITDNGTIMIGPDKGHPTLVKAKPARVAGEIHLLDDGSYRIDDKSRRYSSQQTKEKNIYLRNALEKFRGVFNKETINLAFYKYPNWEIDEETYIAPIKGQNKQ